MRNLGIGGRLAASFFFLLALMVGLTAMSIVEVNYLRSKLTEMNEVNSVKQRYTINFRGSVHDRAIAIRDVVLVQSVAERQAQIELIDTLFVAYADNEVMLNDVLANTELSTDREREIAGRIAGVQAATNPLVDQIIELMAAGNQAEAERILLEEASPLFSDWLGVINEFIDLQEEKNQSAGASVTNQIEQYSMLAMVALVTALLLASAAAYASTRSIIRPLGQLQTALTRMAEGETEIDPRLAARTDALGDVARAVLQVRDAVQDRVRGESVERERVTKQVQKAVASLASGLKALSAGNVRFRINEKFDDELEELRQDFNFSLQQLSAALSSVGTTSVSVNERVLEISGAAERLSERTEHQAATLEETAAAMDDLVNKVKEAADNARTVEHMVDQAREDAENSGAVAKKAVESMSKIESSSNKIDTIISTIEDISFQTNLLALNAGVEAARAGESGRGFAVVASEVRALAQRSSEAALEIKTLISESTAQVAEGVEHVGEMGGELQKIVDRVTDVSSRVSEIARGAEDQSSTIGDINSSITQLDTFTQQNAGMVEEANSACQALQSASADLTRQTATFETDGEADLSAPSSEAA
ncbi:MAG: methyl-accepting chemotaxis protein [Pseudomonadota bacterium]